MPSIGLHEQSDGITGGAQVADHGLEKFRTGSGRVAGYVALLLAVAVAVLVVADGYHSADLKTLLLCAFLAAAFWAALIRPVVAVRGDRLLLRSMVSEVWVPLAAVESVRIGMYLGVRAGGRTFTSVAVGRGKRGLYRQRRVGPDPLRVSADLIEQTLERRAENARAQAGIAFMSDEQFALGAACRRQWAWPVIALLSALAVAVLVGFLL
jgi:hypothetical protein